MRTLVYPAHQLYEPYREEARDNPLQPLNRPNPEVSFQAKPVPGITLYEQGRPLDLSPGSAEHTERFWHAQGGLNTCHPAKSWPGTIHTSAVQIEGPSTNNFQPNAFEIIAHGVGMLRVLKMPSRTASTEAALKVRKPSHITSRLVRQEQQNPPVQPNDQVYLVRDQLPDPSEGWRLGCVALTSSSLIRPEVFGELEQLHARRNDKRVIEPYFQQLSRVYKPVPMRLDDNEKFLDSARTIYGPHGLTRLMPSYALAYAQHLQQGIYSLPPKTTRELIDRVADLLENRIVVDTHPVVAAG